MNEELYSLSPSQAYERIQRLRSKKEYESLTEDEAEELEQLTDIFDEVSSFNYESIDF